MKNIMKALQDAGDPFDSEMEDELLQEAEARARALREAESEEPQPDPAVTPDPAEEPDIGAPEAGVAPPPPEVVPDPATEGAPVMPAPLAQSAAGRSLAAADIAVERPRQRSLRNAMPSMLGIEGTITRGDDPLPAAPARSADAGQRLQRLGFPDRPQTWPSFMAWPPQSVVKPFLSAKTSDEQRREIIRRLLEMEGKMLIRSRQIKEYLDQHNPQEEQDRASRREIDAAGNDPHFGIKWATLVNPGVQDQSLVASVLSWGHCTAKTADGGSVRVHDDAISFSGSSHGASCITPQSMALAMREARNRGWGNVKMQGSYEFGMMAIKAAKEAGIEAEVKYYGKGVLSWKTYTVKVMPNAPLPEMPDPNTLPASAPVSAPATAPVSDGAGKPAAPILDIPDTSASKPGRTRGPKVAPQDQPDPEPQRRPASDTAPSL